MNLTFNDILMKVGISEDYFDTLDKNKKKYNFYILKRKALKDELKNNNKNLSQIQKINIKIDSLNLLLDDLHKYNLEYLYISGKIIEIYTNEIFNNKYIISVESIIKNLDVSISYFNTMISKNLSKLHLPPGKYLIRNLLKDYMHNLNNTNKIKDITGALDDIYINSNILTSLLRKKVLYSIDSYIKYLKNNMILISQNINVKIPLSQNEINIIEKKFNCKSDEELDKIYKNISKNFIKHNKQIIENCDIEEFFEFEKYVEKNFNIISPNYKGVSKNFRSRNYLKTIYEVTYENEVDRIVESSPTSVRIFELRSKDNNKPRKRFMLSTQYIKNKFNETIEKPLQCDDLIYNTDNINIKLPINFFIQYYQKSKFKLKEDLFKFILNN
ncbi:hypothetical protein [Clostridium thermobutyricum]|uniref:hypothetical protein n=1 Tax=Clostridium thermobutyricum TaxID=29372 RepID=UPI0018ABB935|nr:hypothetical protein [Clostridium thermobutyricum]